MLKIKTKSEAKKKPGRKASGLRDLSPDAARYVVCKASLAAVRRAEVLRTTAAKLPGATGAAPSLERMLKGDLEIAAVMVVDDGEVTLQPVLRSTAYDKQLRAAGVPAELVFVAKAFAADVEGSTIGKLTGSYGEGFGGGASAEPERVLMAMDRLVKAQAKLNRSERFTVWSALVFSLPLVDIGWALYGGRGWTRTHLTEAAALLLEAALERMQPWYLAHA